MKPSAGYNRALLKLSGAAFAPAGGRGFGEEQLAYLARELGAAREVCAELAVVTGGGNILQGAKFRAGGPGRVRSDYAGMVATIVNALLLQESLEQAGIPSRVYSALPVAQVAAPFGVESCLADLRQGRIVILAGGTGEPLFTTDTAAALRAVELGAEILLKATRVDGVYSADPEEDEEAELYSRLGYQEVIERRLGVMDLCAVSLCMEHGLPVRVLNYMVEGGIRRALAGESIGTLIGDPQDGH